MRFHLRFIPFLLLLISVSCKTKPGKIPGATETEDGSYFSIKDYAADQWKTFHDQPYGIIKTIALNGKTDTLYTNAEHVNWGDIYKIFFDTDISNKKFADQYTFTSFRDYGSMSDNFVYEAKDTKLFTQKLNITSNINNHKITSIYIETAKNTQWSTHTQRLQYVPVKSISIQEFESSMMGEKKDLKVEYIFL